MATVKFFLDTRTTDSGWGIVKLRITHNRTQRDYSTKLKVTLGLFDKIKDQGSELDRRIKDRDVIELHQSLFAEKDDVRVFSDGYILRAKNIIKRLGENFTFDTFKLEFENYGKEIEIKNDRTDLIKALNSKSLALIKKGQISHGTNFRLMAQSLERFVEYIQVQDPKRLLPKKNFVLRFEHVDSEFLTDWGHFMRIYGKASQRKINNKPISYSKASESTISIYSRALRIVFNDAIKDKIINPELYPFGRYGYVPPSGTNTKRALKTSDIDLIKNYEPEPMTTEQRSHDLWLFSYFGNGMNFADILRLKWENISENQIIFQRRKTKETPQPIVVRMNDTIKNVIKRWGVESTNKNDYIFPFLQGATDIEREKKIIHQTIKTTNKYMNRIGAKLGIKDKLNSYEARHSFATRLMQSNAPLVMIKDKLGHKKLSTTENYLGSFEKEVEDQYLDNL
ncbi:MAG: tyrosine-type recombinase/integrase [Spirosomataceae bacterium]